MAALALLTWPFVMVWMFSAYDRQRALVLSLLVGYLLLPPLLTFYIPGIPGFDKHTIPSVVAAFLLWNKQNSDPFQSAPPMAPFVKLLLAVFIISPLLSNVLNGNVIVEGNSVRPGLDLFSGVKDVMRGYFLVLPMLLGYRYLYDFQGARLLCRYIVLAMMWYSILMLIEIRMSPQLNVWVYGYFQHDFIQTIRYGGYRPIVFLQHPLWVASITATAFVFAVAMAKAEKRGRAWLTVAYMAGALFICKSAGALLMSALFVPLLLLLPARRVVLVAALLVSVATAYPLLRSSPFMPVQGLVDLAMRASPERGRSLEFRLINEDKLLERAMEKPLLGWGGSGRGLLVDPFDGQLQAIPDGLWVIYLGSGGLVSYLSLFLLLAAPVFMLLGAMRRNREASASELMVLTGMAVALAINIVDLIPNATLTSITWLVAGCLMGNAARVYNARELRSTILDDPSEPGKPAVAKPGMATIL